MALMVRVCAWCDAYMGAVWCQEMEEDGVSHGLCDTCSKKMNAELDRMRARRAAARAPACQRRLR